MKTNDLTVVLGTRFEENWRLRQDLIDRLDFVSEMYKQKKVKKILVSGKWTIWYDWLRIAPPTTEARLMKDYLLKKGVAKSDIVLEENSKDTIGNLYYLGSYLERNPDIRNINIVCAEQRQKRISFLVNKLFGNKYKISYSTIYAPNDESSSLGNEKEIFIEQQALFAGMMDGDYKGLRHKLYKSAYYRNQAKEVALGLRKIEI